MTALLEPVLLELDRRLDSILQKMETLLTQLGTGSIHALLVRLEAAVQRDGASGLGQQPCQDRVAYSLS